MSLSLCGEKCALILLLAAPDFASLFNAGLERYSARRFEEAAPLLRQAAQVRPQDFNTRFFWAPPWRSWAGTTRPSASGAPPSGASHQSCLAHLIRRCRDLVEILSPVAARFPRAVKELLEKLLAVRDRYQRHQISPHGRQTAAGRIRTQLDRLLENHYRPPANRRLAKHLDHEFPHLFTFLDCPGVEATNNRAERALRPAVKARYGRGGNRTPAGARTQEVLASVLQTCRQQGKGSFPLLLELLRSPKVFPLDLVPQAQPPPHPRP